MKSLSTTRSNQILALLAVAQLMGVLDFSIVNIALPSIQRIFHLAPADLQWVVSTYALVFGGFLLLGGRAADLFDRKRVFMLGLASLAGGLAPSPLVILGARAAQGLGAAIVSPTALALLTTTFPEGPGRNRALGVFGSVSGIGFGAGVILGGVLTSVLSWRWVFFVNVPLGLLVLLVPSTSFVFASYSNVLRFSWSRLAVFGIGFILLIAGVTVGVLNIQGIIQGHWSDLLALLLLPAFGIGIALFAWAFPFSTESSKDIRLPLAHELTRGSFRMGDETAANFPYITAPVQKVYDIARKILINASTENRTKHGILILGEANAGKTRIAFEVLTHTLPDAQVLRWSTISTTVEIPDFPKEPKYGLAILIDDLQDLCLPEAVE